MGNAEMAAVFEDIAARLRLRKDNIFKIRAYEKVARSIRALDTPVAELAAAGRLGEIDGAGEAITKKITEMVQTGQLAYYEKLKAETPEDTVPAGGSG
jgi:DNA polymerase (family 10)